MNPWFGCVAAVLGVVGAGMASASTLSALCYFTDERAIKVPFNEQMTDVAGRSTFDFWTASSKPIRKNAPASQTDRWITVVQTGFHVRQPRIRMRQQTANLAAPDVNCGRCVGQNVFRGSAGEGPRSPYPYAFSFVSDDVWLANGFNRMAFAPYACNLTNQDQGEQRVGADIASGGFIAGLPVSVFDAGIREPDYARWRFIPFFGNDVERIFISLSGQDPAFDAPSPVVLKVAGDTLPAVPLPGAFTLFLTGIGALVCGTRVKRTR